MVLTPFIKVGDAGQVLTMHMAGMFTWHWVGQNTFWCLKDRGRQ